LRPFEKCAKERIFSRTGSLPSQPIDACFMMANRSSVAALACITSIIVPGPPPMSA
jgi:hypothetical protein